MSSSTKLIHMKHTAYLVPLSPIARICVRQKLFCCGKKMRGVAEKREGDGAEGKRTDEETG